MANILVVTLNSSNFNFLIGRQELEAQIITIKQKKQQETTTILYFEGNHLKCKNTEMLKLKIYLKKSYANTNLNMFGITMLI